MTDLPGTPGLPDRPVTPLAAPAGSFDRVLRRAHARRLRTGLLAGTAVLVVALGSVGAALALQGEGGRQSLVATQPTSAPPTSAPTAGPAPSASPSAPAGPTPSSVTTPRPATPSPAGAVAPTSPAAVAPTTALPPPASTTFTGRAVDAAGRPLAQLHVTLWSAGNALPDEHDGFTGPDGRFTVPCGGKALLLDWMLGGEQHPSTRNLAATWIGGGSTFADARPLPCDGAERVTVVPEGGVLEGAYRGADGGGTLPLPGGPVDAGLSCLPLGTYDGRATTPPTCVVLTASDGRYRLVGLPTGRYVLRTATGAVDVQVVAGRTTVRDLDDCPSCPPPTSDVAAGASDAPPPIR